VVESLEKETEQLNTKMTEMKEDLAKVTKENATNAERASKLNK